MDLAALLNREALLTIAFGLFAAASIVYLLRERSVNPAIVLTDLVTADNGRIASTKFYQSGAFFLSSWIMVFLTVTDKMTDVTLLGYCGVWAAAYAVNKVSNNKAITDAPPPATDVPPDQS